VQIEEVFNATIAIAKNHHRLELIRNNRLSWICEDLRRR